MLSCWACHLAGRCSNAGSCPCVPTMIAASERQELDVQHVQEHVEGPESFWQAYPPNLMLCRLVYQASSTSASCCDSASHAVHWPADSLEWTLPVLLCLPCWAAVWPAAAC